MIALKEWNELINDAKAACTDFEVKTSCKIILTGRTDECGKKGFYLELQDDFGNQFKTVSIRPSDNKNEIWEHFCTAMDYLEELCG